MKNLFINIVVSLLVVAAASGFASEDESQKSSHQTVPARSGAEVAKQCIACHGEDGNSPTPNFPRIAGQHADYMFQSLKSYKNGDRKNAIMAGIVATLSEDEMKNVSVFFASQSGLSAVNISIMSKH